MESTGSRSAVRWRVPESAPAGPEAHPCAYGFLRARPANRAPVLGQCNPNARQPPRPLARAPGIASAGNPVGRRRFGRTGRHADPDDGLLAAVIVDHHVTGPHQRQQGELAVVTPPRAADGACKSVPMSSRRVISMKTFSRATRSHQYVSRSPDVLAIGAVSVAARRAASSGWKPGTSTRSRMRLVELPPLALMIHLAGSWVRSTA